MLQSGNCSREKTLQMVQKAFVKFAKFCPVEEVHCMYECDHVSNVLYYTVAFQVNLHSQEIISCTHLQCAIHMQVVLPCIAILVSVLLCSE